MSDPFEWFKDIDLDRLDADEQTEVLRQMMERLRGWLHDHRQRVPQYCRHRRLATSRPLLGGSSIVHRQVTRSWH